MYYMAKINAGEYLLHIGYIQESVPLFRDWYKSWHEIYWYFHLSQSLLLIDVAVKQLNPNSGAHIIHDKDLFSIQNSSVSKLTWIVKRPKCQINEI